MKCKFIVPAVLVTLVVATAVEEKWLSSAALSAQGAQLQGRSSPIFEVDRIVPVDGRSLLQESPSLLSSPDGILE